MDLIKLAEEGNKRRMPRGLALKRCAVRTIAACGLLAGCSDSAPDLGSSSAAGTREQFIDSYPAAICDTYDRCGWPAPGCVAEVTWKLEHTASALPHFDPDCAKSHLDYLSTATCEQIDASNTCDEPRCAAFFGDRLEGEPCGIAVPTPDLEGLSTVNDCRSGLACRWQSDAQGDACEIACP